MDGLEVNLKTQTVYDHDKDGRPDILDMDDDGDGIPSVLEGIGDVDKDGLANYLDTDSDGDGVLDKDEVVFSAKDVDFDRIDDRFDADIQSGADRNGDGIIDKLAFADANNNKIPDFLDKSIRGLGSLEKAKLSKIAKRTQAQIPKNDSKPTGVVKSIKNTDDTDGDGLTNSIELALGLNPMQSDSDGDGLNDLLEVGVNPKSPQDSDRDGIIDAIDNDDDNDGIPTKVEIQVSKKLNYKLDTDNDGVFNYQDANDDGDSRLTKLEGSASDYDKDGIPDYLDHRDGVSKASTAKLVVLYDKTIDPTLKSTTKSFLNAGKTLEVVASD